MDTAKLFWSGRSQAVRLPKEFRFDGEEVRIRRHGQTVILEPVNRDWSWLDRVQVAFTGGLDADAVEATTTDVAQQARPGLDDLFR